MWLGHVGTLKTLSAIPGGLEAFHEVVVFGMMADPKPDPCLTLAKG